MPPYTSDISNATDGMQQFNEHYFPTKIFNPINSEFHTYTGTTEINNLDLFLITQQTFQIFNS